jgi:hypothetical protein
MCPSWFVSPTSVPAGSLGWGFFFVWLCFYFARSSLAAAVDLLWVLRVRF